MPCYYPLKGWLSKDVNPSGKRSIVFKESDALLSASVSLPCGQCIGCRLERSRQWAIRCVHEASLWEDNCFITLTFNEENLRSDGSLVKSDFQKFIKRLRKKHGSGVRYFHCGEYGSQMNRPHHHACLFNFTFKDKVLWTIRNGVRLYRSEELEKLWPFGFCTIGDVTFESAAYAARYCLKKVTNNRVHPKFAEDHYGNRIPEYITMSRRPGIGREWYSKFKGDVFPDGFVTIRGGIRCRVPEYYERIFELTNPDIYASIKDVRGFKAFNDPDNKPDRLKEREFCHNEKAKRLERSYENVA